jgi:hypothetical protein
LFSTDCHMQHDLWCDSATIWVWYTKCVVLQQKHKTDMTSKLRTEIKELKYTVINIQQASWKCYHLQFKTSLWIWCCTLWKMYYFIVYVLECIRPRAHQGNWQL